MKVIDVQVRADAIHESRYTLMMMGRVCYSIYIC